MDNTFLHSAELEAKLGTLPTSPGVYKFKDKDGTVIYVAAYGIHCLNDTLSQGTHANLSRRTAIGDRHWSGGFKFFSEIKCPSIVASRLVIEAVQHFSCFFCVSWKIPRTVPAYFKSKPLHRFKIVG